MPPNAPKLSSGNPAALAVTVAGRRRLVGLDQVRRIAEAGPLTPLPGCRPPMAGLARVEDRPMVQFDSCPGTPAAGEDGEAAGRLLVLAGRTSDQEIALRVTAVTVAGPDEAAGLEPLPVASLWPGLVAARPRPQAPPAGAARSAAALPAELEVLLLDCGGQTLALLLDGIEGVAVVEAVDTVTTLGGRPQRLARIEGRALPAVVLAERFSPKPEGDERKAEPAGGERKAEPAGGERKTEPAGGWAVVGVAAGHRVALLLSGHARLGRIATRAVMTIAGVPGALAWWQAGPNAPPVGLYRFATLAGAPGQPAPLPLPPPEPPTGAEAWQPGDGRVRLGCGAARWSLPLALVRRALDGDESANPAVLGRRRRPGALPVLDGTLLLTGRPGRRPGLWLHLAPGPGNELILIADRLEPEGPEPEDGWLPPPALPAAAAALIAAVRWDPHAARWILRLSPVPAFAALPMAARRALAAARVGWWSPAESPPAAVP